MTATVSAERMSMTGALMVVPLAVAEMGIERLGSMREIWGETIISTMPIVGDEGSHLQDDADILV